MTRAEIICLNVHFWPNSVGHDPQTGQPLRKDDSGRAGAGKALPDRDGCAGSNIPGKSAIDLAPAISTLPEGDIVLIIAANDGL